MVVDRPVFTSFTPQDKEPRCTAEIEALKQLWSRLTIVGQSFKNGTLFYEFVTSRFTVIAPEMHHFNSCCHMCCVTRNAQL